MRHLGRKLVAETAATSGTGEMSIQQHEAWVGDQRVHYRLAGSGPPMLLLHGVGESSASWIEVLPALSARHTVYAPDLPGCGDSTPIGPNGADFAPQHLAALMVAFLDAVGVGSADPVAVVGNSLGGSTAIELAAQHPNRVRCLVLENSAGLGRYVHPALRALTIPGYGELAIRVAQTRIGAVQRP